MIKLEEAKAYLDVTHHEDDGVIQALVLGAMARARAITGHSIYTGGAPFQEDVSLPWDIPRGFYLGTVYSVADNDALTPVPVADDDNDNVGYSVAGDQLCINPTDPNGNYRVLGIEEVVMEDDVRVAVLMLISHFYDNRGIAAVGGGVRVEKLPQTAEAILLAHRESFFG